MRRELACACGTAALVLSANWAHAEEPKSSEDQRAEEARIESKPRWDLVIGGVAFFGASYLGAAFFGVAYEDCFSAHSDQLEHPFRFDLSSRSGSI